MKLTIKSASWHRNGVGGVGFWSILFNDLEQGDMHASLFDEPGYCAVHSLDWLAKGSIEFGENSWRGDTYEAHLRPLLKRWLKKHGSNRLGMFSMIPETAIAKATGGAK